MVFFIIYTQATIIVYLMYPIRQRAQQKSPGVCGPQENCATAGLIKAESNFVFQNLA